MRNGGMEGEMKQWGGRKRRRIPDWREEEIGFLQINWKKSQIADIGRVKILDTKTIRGGWVVAGLREEQVIKEAIWRKNRSNQTRRKKKFGFTNWVGKLWSYE